jgi:hypothetical protein
MRFKKSFLAVLFLLLSLSIFGQDGGIKGILINRLTRQPVKDAKIIVKTADKDLFVYSGADGTFKMEGIADGMYQITIEAANFINSDMNIKVEGYVKDLMTVTIAPDFATEDIDDAAFAEFDNENEAGYEDIPSVLSSSKDVYENIAGYKFSSMRFLSRGYDSGTADVYINGIYMNDALSGYTPYSLFSGLNEVTREKESVTGLQVTDYGTSGINGATNIFTRASKIKKGWRTSVLSNSGQYRLRVMATYATGEMDNGWSFSASASTRLGGNDWVTGVYYQSFAYYIGAEKNINDKHRFSLNVFGSPTQRGAQAASTQEVYDMLGNNYYNPNWGYQNGKVRNARVRDSHEPVGIFNYEFTPSADTKLSVGVSYRMGRNGYSALDWYDAQDPRPDYYRNLPSYYDDPQKAAWVREGWLSDDNIRHINWSRLYDVNRNSVQIDSKARSKYVIEERHTDQNDLNANLQFTQRWRFLKLNIGYNYRWNKTEYFKTIKDLLGGECWLDVDQFAERDFGIGDIIQNDLNNPNRLVKEGDKYGYDYFAQVRDHKGWVNLTFYKGGFEAVLAGNAGYNTFWRDGLYKKGLFPDNSYGPSQKQNFFTYTGKLGLTYKFKGNNMIYANAGYMTRAPFFQESFLSPRTRNTIVPNLTTEKILSADLNYSLKIGEFALRITGFFTDIKDQTKLISFYDDIQRSYTNFAMSGIDQRHIGLEAGIKVPIWAGISVSGAVSYGKYVYTSNPYVTQTIDNSNRIVLENAKVYWEGYRVPSTPQLSSDISLNYRGPKYLFASIDLGYYDGMYISMNPLRRTDYAVKGMDISTEEGMNQLRAMTDQERFPRAFVLGASIGKSWYIHRKYNLGVNLDVRNILNNQNIKTGGFEQMRLTSNEDSSGNFVSYSAFDSKYFYMFGINYMINVYFRF